MQRIEKTVFISYRRTNAPWAIAIYQDLTHNGYDVFFDFEGIGPGDFESAILANIISRAHFLIVLTPSALERCDNPGDWLRREIETAIESKRNIVPLMLDGFDFGSPRVAGQLTGTLASLSTYNGIGMNAEYFFAAMEKLRARFLNVPVVAELLPAPQLAQRAAKEQKTAADVAPPVKEEELTAQQYFEKALASSDADERIRLYSEAILLNPDFGEAYNNRGVARKDTGDLDGAIDDYNRSIQLRPDNARVYSNRCVARRAKGDLLGALEDGTRAINLFPDSGEAYSNRAGALLSVGDIDGAFKDLGRAIQLKPNDAKPYFNRGIAFAIKGDADSAISDLNTAIQLQPGHERARIARGKLFEQKGLHAEALADFRQYLELGGDARYGDAELIQEVIELIEQKLK